MLREEQGKALLLRAIDGDLVTGIGVTHHPGARVVGQHAGDTRGGFVGGGDAEALAGVGGTIVVLMGVKHLPEIAADRLFQHDPATRGDDAVLVAELDAVLVDLDRLALFGEYRLPGG